MLAYIIRLDDATPKMNKAGWEKVENLLDKYKIKPIVGIIPDSQDSLFTWDEDSKFWTETVARWQTKGWTIAQHGCHHVYHECDNGLRSEFIGLTYQEQMNLIQLGYNKLKQNNVTPTCFFAPAHTFDNTTVDVCRDSGLFSFISDGYSIYPFAERSMLFFPSIFDTAHKILPFGVYTFVLHPSFTTEKELIHFEEFIKSNQKSFIPVPEILESIDTNRKITLPEKGIAPTIRIIRRLRRKIRGF